MGIESTFKYELVVDLKKLAPAEALKSVAPMQL